MSMLGKRVEQLKDLADLQSQPGNWDAGEYQHGMANGLRLALSIMTGRDPEFLEMAKPKVAQKEPEKKPAIKASGDLKVSGTPAQKAAVAKKRTTTQLSDR